MIEVEKALPENALVFAAMEQASDTKDYILPYALAEHIQKMLDPNIVYLRILHENALAGFFILSLDPDGTSIEFRRVVVSVKGRGIGQAAIRAMEQFCRTELNRQRIWLDVFEHNHRGRHIYKKLGYEKYGESTSEGKRLLLYQKQL